MNKVSVVKSPIIRRGVRDGLKLRNVCGMIFLIKYCVQQKEKSETTRESVIVHLFSKYHHSNGKPAFLKYKDNHEKREP